MALLLATILPSILIILFFVYSDKFKEPRGEIIKVFIYGIFYIFQMEDLAEKMSIWAYVFLMIGLVQKVGESLKFSSLKQKLKIG